MLKTAGDIRHFLNVLSMRIWIIMPGNKLQNGANYIVNLKTLRLKHNNVERPCNNRPYASHPQLQHHFNNRRMPIILYRGKPSAQEVLGTKSSR